MFEEYEGNARTFVNDVACELGHPDNHRSAIRIMTSVMHTIRDILTVEESLHLISELPLFIKGFYVNEWHVGEKKKIKDKDEFIEQLLLHDTKTGPLYFGTDEKAIKNVKAVLRALRKHVTQGEIDDIIVQFPAELKDLWLTDENILSLPDSRQK